jgi:DNA polymerase/3'-5' exonuclease PolX
MKIPEVDRVIAAALGVTGGAVADPGDEPAEPELSSLMQLPGLGAKRARRLYDELGIRTLDDLAAALATGRVQALRGFGADMQERLIVDLLALQRRSRRFALPAVEHHIAPLIDYMRDGPGVERIEVAGSFRRRSDTVGDVDLLAVSARPVPVLRYFAAYPDADHVEASDVTRGIIVLKSGLRVKLRVVPRRCYGATLQYLTGSVAHNARGRRLASSGASASASTACSASTRAGQAPAASAASGRRTCSRPLASSGCHRSCARAVASWSRAPAAACRR